jgi:hypothetical protein
VVYKLLTAKLYKHNNYEEYAAENENWGRNGPF